MKRQQRKVLQKKFRIIMWTVLSRDYDAGVSREKCLEKTWQYTRPGAIIVFHDHPKSIEKLKFVLPEYLKRARDGGFHFRGIGY
jgi:peptidoglycan/xylan/chitin deacetylase (PgdA/CDA1 family)